MSLKSSGSGVTRNKPGEFLFADEEALSLKGFINEDQMYFYGIRCPGYWSVWKTWGVGFMTSQELIPGILILNPAALVLMLPSAAMFTPFPIQKVTGWGSSNNAFSFRHQAAQGVFNVISFTNLNASAMSSKLEQLIEFTMQGGLPQNPFPLKYGPKLPDEDPKNEN